MEETTNPVQPVEAGLPRKLRIVIGVTSGLLLVGGLATIMNALSKEPGEDETAEGDVNTTDTI